MTAGRDRGRSLWVHSYAHPVTVLGPGRRVVLWVAGCSLRCRGCVTPQLWDRGAGVRLAAGAVADRLLAIDEPLDGITLTGGEPFEQAKPLGALLSALARERPDWSTLVYSGRSLAALRRAGPDAERLLARTDILVAGPYRQDRPATHVLAGSGNQRIHYLSDRGSALRATVETPPTDRVNLGLSASGEQHWLIGVVDAAARASLKVALGGGAATSGGPSCPT